MLPASQHPALDTLDALDELSARLRARPVIEPAPVRTRHSVVVRVRIPRFWNVRRAQGRSSGLLTTINNHVYSLICQ
jgi:hypothetical protein